MTMGDGAVGKTSITRRYTNKGFKEAYSRTVGNELYTGKEEYQIQNTGTSHHFEINWTIWDIGGQPTFDEVRSSYYEGASGAILIYDITRPETFESLPDWVSEFWDDVGSIMPFVLIGNKTDLGNKREIPQEYGEKYTKALSQQCGGRKIPFTETSAKDDKNIDKAFKLLARAFVTWELL